METEVREENDLTFSYNLVRPLFHRKDTQKIFKWSVMEKGSKKINPEEGYNITYDIIKSALHQNYQMRIHIPKTRYKQIPLLEDRGFKIYFNKTYPKVMDNVKARGVIYSLLQLSDKQKHKGVIAISTGSFACSLCHFAKKFGIPVTVVLLISTAREQINMCRALGARVCFQDNIVEAHKEALRIAKERGLVYIDGNDHPNMIIGQATLGIEIWKDADAVILPTSVDGCGLTAGIAMAIKGRNPNIKVIKVQHAVSDLSIDLVRSKTMSNKELDIPVAEYYWHENDRGIVQSLFDENVKVMNTSVRVATEFLRQGHHFTDFNAAIGLAAILTGKLDDLKRKEERVTPGNFKVVIPVFGEMDSYVELIDNE